MKNINTKNRLVKTILAITILVVVGIGAYYISNNKPSASVVTKDVLFQLEIKYDKLIEKELSDGAQIKPNVLENSISAVSPMYCIGDKGCGFGSYDEIARLSTNNSSKKIINPYKIFSAPISSGNSVVIKINLVNSEENSFKFSDTTPGKKSNTSIEMKKSVNIALGNPTVYLGTFEIVRDQQLVTPPPTGIGNYNGSVVLNNAYAPGIIVRLTNYDTPDKFYLSPASFSQGGISNARCPEIEGINIHKCNVSTKLPIGRYVATLEKQDQSSSAQSAYNWDVIASNPANAGDVHHVTITKDQNSYDNDSTTSYFILTQN